MSGLCGFAHVEGAPGEGPVLERMTSAMARRGPDGRATWLGESAGLGHTLLRVDTQAPDEAQPFCLDGQTWIVADARLDARDELLSRLAGAGEPCARGAGDAQLLLRAWRAWGEACVDRILGDFAFAIWDAAQRTLFCARDPLGVKPFFYAQRAKLLVFGNTLASLRAHPAIEPALDELAIADFLLFEASQEPGATVFAAIRRLPPAHCLSFSPRGLRIRRYWTLESPPLARYARQGEYLERFDEVLALAVSDRVRSPEASVLMSGGIDSPALASVAARGARVHAFSAAYDELFPDEERRYSTLAAAGLRIPITHRAADGYGLFDRYASLASYFCEPVNAPFAALEVDLAADAASHSRVALTGWDGDALLSESPRPYFAWLRREGRWRELAAALARHAVGHPGASLRSVLLRLGPRVEARPQPSWPEWIDAGFAARHRLRERWRAAHAAQPRPPDRLRPYAHGVFAYLAQASSFFETSDPGRTGVPIEMRHPMMDLRVVRFCLSLPPVPWCVRKEILRRWLRGRVPEEVRLRAKTPLAGYPHVAVLALGRSASVASPRLSPDAAAFIDQGKMDSIGSVAEPATAWANLRPAGLDLWFRHARSA